MLHRTWPAEGLTRVPYWVYQDEDVYREEQHRIWRGATWSYLCLEAELPEPQSFVTTFVGDMPVVVTRDTAGALRRGQGRRLREGRACARRALMEARGAAGALCRRAALLFASTRCSPFRSSPR
jgi:hypothetical protein